MPRLIPVLLACLALAAAAFVGPEPVCASGQCGIQPIKPIVPIGCRDVVPVCVCDANGRNCRWEWQCVR